MKRIIFILLFCVFTNEANSQALKLDAETERVLYALTHPYQDKYNKILNDSVSLSIYYMKQMYLQDLSFDTVFKALELSVLKLQLTVGDINKEEFFFKKDSIDKAFLLKEQRLRENLGKDTLKEKQNAPARNFILQCENQIDDTLAPIVWSLLTDQCQSISIDAILREMLAIHGNPKLRFMPYKEDGRAHYHVKKNSIYLRLFPDSLALFPASLEEFMAEIAHAEQFKNSRCIKQEIKCYTRVLFRRIKNRKISWRDAYDEEYELKGSIEYEAHKIIQPQMNKEFLLLSNQSQSLVLE